MTIAAKPYLDYLDKEMTIMGVLSGFSFAAAALLAKESSLLSAIAHQALGSMANAYFVILGVLLMAGAGVSFYLQRSHLALRFEGLALWATGTLPAGESLGEVISGGDTWSFWIPYQLGIVLAIGSLFAYAGAALPSESDLRGSYGVLVLAAVLIIGAYIIGMRVLNDKAEFASNDAVAGASAKKRPRRRTRSARKLSRKAR
jgi:hypothetical protein